MTHRRAAIVAVMLLVSLIATRTVAATGTTEDPAAGETIVLTGLTNYDPQNTGDAETQAYLLRKEYFLAEYPTIDIGEEVLAYGDMVTKLRTLAAGDQLPHFFKLGSDVTSTYARAGAISSIDYMFEEAGLSSFPTTWDEFAAAGS